MSEIDARGLLKHPVRLIAIGFGSGLVPRAPGTAGTVIAIPLVLLTATLPLWVYLVLITGLFVVGVWVCHETTRYLGVHDHPVIVWDELVGYMIGMIAVPITWPVIVAGFVLFRAFDIIKPWPIGWLDRHVRGGLGVMIDDAVAGLYTVAVLHLGFPLGILTSN
jgi:phosphatidylglycerophosphatase A